MQAVSQDLGYDSVSAFITMFKKALGTESPGRYLAAKRNGIEVQKPQLTSPMSTHSCPPHVRHRWQEPLRAVGHADIAGRRISEFDDGR